MSIVFAGTPLNAAVTLRELALAGTPIGLVLTRPDAPVGRKAVLTQSPVADAADELGIPVIKTNAIDENVIVRLTLGEFSFAIVVAFGVILRKAALESLPKGWFNVHYSLLPKWRGAAPVQHAIIAQELETGVTIFRIDSGLDTGPIIDSVATQVQPHENSGQLLERLTFLGISLALSVIPRIEAGIAGEINQDDAKASLAPKLGRLNGLVTFDCDARVVDAKIRGVSPEPGAWTLFNGQSLKIHSARPHNDDLPLKSIENRNGRILVGCRIGSLELLEVQPAGKNRMSAGDWYRGVQGKQIVMDSNV